MDFLVAALAQYGFVLSFALAALVWLRLPRRRKLGLLITGIIGGLLCLAFIKVGGALFYDPRPLVTELFLARAPQEGVERPRHWAATGAGVALGQ